MSRHLIFAIAIAAFATATVLLLASAEVFTSLGQWLAAQYQREALLKGAIAPEWPWLGPVAAGLAALLVAWVAVDLSPWAVKLAVPVVTGVALVFLSLTLALYGMAFNPWPAIAGCGLAFAMGALLAETPASRRRREWHARLGDRAGAATLAEWDAAGEAPWLGDGTREAAVLAVRALNPVPAPEKAADQLAMLRQVLEEAAKRLRHIPGVILDAPAGDGLRAFFGFSHRATQGGLDEAARAALDLARFFQEEATLRAQAEKPAAHFGIGLSHGTLLTGQHGPQGAAFWTASGQSAEQARQLAALNARHHSAILVGRRAAERLAAHFELKAVEGDVIHALLAPKAAAEAEETPLADPLEADAPSPASPAALAPAAMPSQPTSSAADFSAGQEKPPVTSSGPTPASASGAPPAGENHTPRALSSRRKKQP